MKILTIITAILLTSSAWAIKTQQTYEVTFTSNWNVSDHLDAPGNAHFSPIVAVAHNQNYSLLPVGELASPGLELVAELGQTRVIVPEINAQQAEKNVTDLVLTEDMFINQQTQQTYIITVSKEQPLLSMVTMIAPSPDWVVGINGIELFDAENGFVNEVVDMPLFAMDAGTESGDFGGNFSIGNDPSVPTAIQQLMGPGFSAPFAFVTIKKMN